MNVIPGPESRPFSCIHWLIQIFLLIAISSVLALCVNALRPQGLSWHDPLIRTVSWPELAAQIQNRQAQLVDARPQADYLLGHAAGALNLPMDKKSQTLSLIFQTLPTNTRLIIYCQGKTCPASRTLARFLISNGLPPARIAVFPPGWDFLCQQKQLPCHTGAVP